MNLSNVKTGLTETGRYRLVIDGVPFTDQQVRELVENIRAIANLQLQQAEQIMDHLIANGLSNIALDDLAGRDGKVEHRFKSERDND